MDGLSALILDYVRCTLTDIENNIKKPASEWFPLAIRLTRGLLEGLSDLHEQEVSAFGPTQTGSLEMSSIPIYLIYLGSPPTVWYSYPGFLS